MTTARENHDETVVVVAVAPTSPEAGTVAI
jgi:hypothetical protein